MKRNIHTQNKRDKRGHTESFGTGTISGRTYGKEPLEGTNGGTSHETTRSIFTDDVNTIPWTVYDIHKFLEERDDLLVVKLSYKENKSCLEKDN